MMQRSLQIMETWANGYSYESTHGELYNDYQRDRAWMVFGSLCLLVVCTKVDIALEG